MASLSNTEDAETIVFTPNDSKEVTVVATPTPQPKASTGKTAAFWLSYIAVLLTTLLGALDLTAVSTALPTITSDLNGGDEFVWIGTAYALASTAFLPMSGNLADIFGRRPIMLLSIVLFAIGSALAGSAQNMTWLIAARAVQGVGGGGILNLSDIIVSDLVPLAERGLYQGVLVLLWAFASAIGPPIGGALAEKASWRWLFYLNLPVSGIALVFVLFFLRVRTPQGNMLNKLASVDWFGNFIVIAGITLSNVGLAWAGVRYPWSDGHVLGPLISGLALVVVFIAFQKYVPRIPTIPWDVVTNRTALSAFLGTFIHAITSISLIYYMPVYFQAVKLASPIRSGVLFLPSALLIAPSALVGGVVIQVFKRYVPVNYVGWVITVVGFGILSLLSTDSGTKNWVGFQILVAIGTGIMYSSTIFPLLAPLPVERTATALAFFAFLQAFAQTWGITISGTILQNELERNLPLEFSSRFPSGVEIAYSAIPLISSLPEPLQTEVKIAFATSLSIIWKTMIGIAGAGLLSVLLMQEIAMHDTIHETYALDNEKATATV